MTSKKDIRFLYLQKRKKLGHELREVYSQKIAALFMSHFSSKGNLFHVFKNMEKFNEIDTSFIIDELLNQHKKVVLPKMQGKNLISCEINKKQDYRTNSYGVEEPFPCQPIDDNTIDIVIVPMLICDKKGMRLGYGGGYYDRFLKNLKVLKVGINFFAPFEEFLPSEHHDIPLDYLITPEKIHTFPEM